eukprot:UN0066
MANIAGEAFQEAETRASGGLRFLEGQGSLLSIDFSSDSDLLVAHAEVYKLRGEASLRQGNHDKAVSDACDASTLASIDLGLLSALVPHRQVPVPCQHCGEIVPKHGIKRHRKRECPKRVIRCECGEDVFAVELEDHKADVCSRAFVVCFACKMRMCRDSLESHQQVECHKRQVCCRNPGCSWTGPWDALDQYHAETCPQKMASCSFCFEQLAQSCMPSHICHTIRVSQDCRLCREPFKALVRKSCPPSIFAG